MDLQSGSTAGSRRKSLAQAGAGGLSRLAGLVALLALALAGGAAQRAWRLTLPGPVIGLALLAGALVLGERFHQHSHRQMTRHVVPVGRFLVSHMGLLFVPAGVGIITEVDVLRRAWWPILVAVLGSTLICLVATGWLMHRLAAQKNKD